MQLRKITSFGLLFSARVAGAASLFAVNLLIARYLGIEALADYAVFISLVSIIAVIVSAGFTSIAPIFVAEYFKKNQPELLKGFIQNALKNGTKLLSAFAFGLFGISFFTNTPPFINNFEMGAAVLITASATAILGFNGAILVGMKKQVAAFFPETLVRPVIFLSLSSILLAAGIVTSIGEVFWLLALSVWLTFGFVFVRDRKIRKDLSEINKEEDGARWTSASLPWMGVTLLWDFMIDIMLLLISILAGSIELAILHICFRYRVLAGFGMRTIHSLLMPEITEQAVTRNMEGVQKKLFQVNTASLLYSLATMAGFAFFGNWLLGIFSVEAANAVPVLLIVSATMFIRAVFGPAPLILAVHNFHTITLKVSMVSVVVALVGIWVSFSTFGILAAACCYTSANLIISATLWYFAKRKTGIDCSILVAVQRKILTVNSYTRSDTTELVKETRYADGPVAS